MKRRAKGVTGVYTITHIESGKTYVGSSINIKLRWEKHRYELKRGVHECNHLLRSWNKYGAEAFEFAIAEVVEDVAELLAREQFHMDETRKICTLFNARLVAESNYGLKHTEETKERQRLVKLGKPRSPETISKIIASKQAKPYVATLEQRAKRAASRIGYVHPPETRAKISLAQKGKPRQPNSPEARAKISVANKGKVVPPDVRLKMSIGKVAYWAELRRNADVCPDQLSLCI